MALRIPLKWLQDYVNPGPSADALAERLTIAGLEVEAVHRIGGWDRELVRVGQVEAVQPHPNADRLCLVTVAYGAAEPLTVVTGAPNLLAYRTHPLPGEPLKVAFAAVGAELVDAYSDTGGTVKLKASKIRGVRSEGMVCSEKELGLSDEHEGIMLLPADAPTGTPLADYLGEAVLEFDIKGSFAHLMSIYGVARETAAVTGRPLHRDVLARRTRADGQATPTPDFLRLEIADPVLCPRYTAVLVEGITVQPSPFWLQQRLVNAGQRPINAVVDATNYVMLELGQPLHAFDYDTVRPERPGEAPLIRVRTAAPGETLRTLDGVERKLDERMLLITDGGGPIGLAGVMGGENSEITDTTRNVLLESASFEFLNTRRTGQVLKLRTEAGDRFGKQLSPEGCLRANLRCAHLIAELCGGTVRAQYGDLFPNPPQPQPIALPQGEVQRLLGMQVPREEIVRILEQLEFEVEGDDPLQVTPPAHRMDIARAADLVEEVGRIYGYDRMTPSLIGDEMPPQRRNPGLDGTERVRDLLAGCGLDEIITYSLISLDDERRLHPDGNTVDPRAYVSVQNPLSADRAHLRRRLLAEGLNTVRSNLRFLERVAVFEVGRVFEPQPGAVLPAEPRRLCALLTGPREPESWLNGQPAPYDFFDAKGVTEALLDGLNIHGATWHHGDDPSYHPGRSARVMLEGTPLGHVGELHPRVVMACDLPRQPVCAIELDLERLLALWQEDQAMAPLSSHPPVYEDLALVVDEGLAAERVRELISHTGGTLLRDVRLFDVYQGEQIGEGRKSLAYALTYQADDRTLTDKEVKKVRDRIVQRLEQELGAQLRA